MSKYSPILKSICEVAFVLLITGSMVTAYAATVQL